MKKLLPFLIALTSCAKAPAVITDAQRAQYWKALAAVNASRAAYNFAAAEMQQRQGELNALISGLCPGGRFVEPQQNKDEPRCQ